MTELVALLGLGGGALWAALAAARLARRLFGAGDDLHSWLEELRRLRDRPKRRRRPATMATRAAVAATVVLVLVIYPAARDGSGWAALTVTRSAWWAFDSVVLARWPWLVAVALVWLAVTAHEESRKALRGEPADRRGRARAAALDLVTDAARLQLGSPAFADRATRLTPKVGRAEWATFRVGGSSTTYGWRVPVELVGDVTPAKIMARTSGGMNAQDDPLATGLASAVRDAWRGNGEQVRTIKAFTSRPPRVRYTTVLPGRDEDDQPDPSTAVLVAMARNPLSGDPIPYPAVRPAVPDLDTPIPIAVDLEGRVLSVNLDVTPHIGVFGTTGSGKSWGVDTIACSISGSPVVAPVVIDLKGRRGDLAPLAPRAAATATDPQAAAWVIEWVHAEMIRRQNIDGRGRIQTFTRDLPRVVVFLDEWQKLDDDSLRLLDDIMREARAVGIHVLLSTQIMHAEDMPKGAKALLAQLSVVLAFRLAKAEHSRMALGDGLPKGLGPHLIPPSWRGVMWAKLGEDGQPVMARMLQSGPDVLAAFVADDVAAGLRIELPGLADWIEARRAAEAADEGPPAGQPAARADRLYAAEDLPAAVTAAVADCVRWLNTPPAGDLPPDPPVVDPTEQPFTVRQLVDFTARASRWVNQTRGMTAADRNLVSAHKATVAAWARNPSTIEGAAAA